MIRHKSYIIFQGQRVYRLIANHHEMPGFTVQELLWGRGTCRTLITGVSENEARAAVERDNRLLKKAGNL